MLTYYQIKGEKMRLLLIIYIFSALSYAQERLCIEVLSVDKKTDISKDFIRKLSKISLAYEYKEVAGRHKIFVGDFATRKDAELVLPKIQAELNKDAFVTVVNFEDKTEVLSSQAKMQHAALMAKAQMIIKPIDKKEKEKPAIEKQKVVLIDIVGPQEKKVIKTKPKIVKKQKVKVVKNLVCKSTKKALRETEISDALEFYKSSSFYTFNAN